MTEVAETKLGGDPASIRAVAAWFRDTLAPRVEEAAAAVGYVLCARFESWEDDAGRAFGRRLASGHRKMDVFAAAIKRRAALLEEIADTLDAAEARMREADRVALQGGLRVESGLIHAPEYGRGPDGEPENRPLVESMEIYGHRLEVFKQAEALAEDAYTMVREKLVGDDSYDWNNLIFHAGDIIKETGAELIQRAEASPTGTVIVNIPGSSPIPLRPSSLTKLVVRGSGPILLAVGAAYSLYAGDPLEKVVLTTGIAFAGGAVGGALAVWIYAIVGATPPAWLSGVVVALSGISSSQFAGWAYDQKRSARDKLLDLTPSLDPGRRELPD